MGQLDIVDNFLPEQTYQALLSVVTSPQFPWFYNPSTVNDADRVGQEAMHDFQFVHSVYFQSRPNSPFYEAFLPMLEAIAPTALIRIKLNCTTWLPDQTVGAWHKDYDAEGVTTSVYYFNTNNGGTVLEDGTCIDSVRNRLATFPANTLHAAKSSSDVKQRLVANFLYFA